MTSFSDDGRYGPDRLVGGCYVPETLVAPLNELTDAWHEAMADTGFRRELQALLGNYVGRPTPVSYAPRLIGHAGGARIYLKREDLAHTGAHKINNALGQCLLAVRMGKTRIIAETGAGQHGVATATACAHLGLECVVYMGELDMARQAPNVVRMRLLGAQVEPVETGSRTLKDAINAALRDWAARVGDTHYVIGSALGPHPYPAMVREFQRVIGAEARDQLLAQTGRLPDVVVACVGGGSNAIGLFSGFVDDRDVRLIGVEAAGAGTDTPHHAARFASGNPGVLHGTRTQLLQNADGQVLATHSVSAGLDYPAIGPEHVALHRAGRAEYVAVTDAAALAAFRLLAKTEGILPALESAHAIAHGLTVACRLPADAVVLINCSGRGDKDVETVQRALQDGVPLPAVPRAVPAASTSATTVPFKPGGIDRALATAAAEDRTAFIPYVTAGVPSLADTPDVLLAIADAGADVIELGVPFSDPVADGPVNQAAANQALDAGATLPGVLGAIATARDRGLTTPVALFSYCNPLLALGDYAAAIRTAGADGLLVVDLPPEEAGAHIAACREAGIATPFLAAPTTTTDRLDRIGRASTGFVYCVSRLGVTGDGNHVDPAIVDRLATIRTAVRHPLAVGFGIAMPDHAAAIAPHADAVVVGSALMRRIMAAPERAASVAAALTTDFVAALRGRPALHT